MGNKIELSFAQIFILTFWQTNSHSYRSSKMHCGFLAEDSRGIFCCSLHMLIQKYCT